MSRFATGVCVVSYYHPQSGQIDGVTISAFSSLSLSPLKILFCLGNQGTGKDRLAQIERFSVNILAGKQKALAYQFAGQNRDNIDTFFSDTDGVPTLIEGLATLVCHKGNRYAEGDHDIIIGDVEQIFIGDKNRQPLLYYQATMVDNYQHTPG